MVVATSLAGENFQPTNFSDFDPNNFMTMMIRILRFIGQWPSSSDSRLYQLYGAILLWGIMVMPLVGEITYLFGNTHDLVTFTYGCCLLTCMILCAVKMLNLKYRFPLMLEMLAEVTDHFTPIMGNKYEYEIMQESLVSFRRVAIFLYSFTTSGVFASILVPAMDKFTTHLMGAYYPYINTLVSPYYELQYLLESVNLCVIIPGVNSYDIIFNGLSAYCIARMKCICFLFKNLREISTSQVREVRSKALSRNIYHNENLLYGEKELIDAKMCELLKKGVVEHNKLLCLVSKMENLYWPTIFLQFFVTSVNICCAGFQVITIDVSTNMALLVWMLLYVYCLTIENFIPAWYGNRIMEVCDELSFSVYSCNWTEGSPRFRKLMLILLGRLYHPLTVNIGLLGELSLQLFCSMMSLGYKMFTVMKTMYDNNEE